MSTVVGWNPFQNEPLKVPDDYEWLKSLTKSAGGDSDKGGLPSDHLAPFNRLVDAWLLAIALGARHRDGTRVYEAPNHRFEYGMRLAGDVNAINFLHHVALAELLRGADGGEAEEQAAYTVIEDPSKVIAICNDLAARGMPILRDMIDGAGSLPPLAELIRSLATEVAE